MSFFLEAWHVLNAQLFTLPNKSLLFSIWKASQGFSMVHCCAHLHLLLYHAVLTWEFTLNDIWSGACLIAAKYLTRSKKHAEVQHGSFCFSTFSNILRTWSLLLFTPLLSFRTNPMTSEDLDQKKQPKLDDLWSWFKSGKTAVWVLLFQIFRLKNALSHLQLGVLIVMLMSPILSLNGTLVWCTSGAYWHQVDAGGTTQAVSFLWHLQHLGEIV